MQMRFDGLLGFPGGIVDPGEEPVAGLNRELHEEIHLDLDKYGLTDANHLRTYYHAKKNLVLHFFAKEVTLEQFKEIEKDSLLAYEHGIEVCKTQDFHMSYGLKIVCDKIFLYILIQYYDIVTYTSDLVLKRQV